MSKALYFIEEHRQFATIRGGILLFPADYAIKLIQEAHSKRIRVLGIDSYLLTDKSTEPMFDHKRVLLR